LAREPPALVTSFGDTGRHPLEEAEKSPMRIRLRAVALLLLMGGCADPGPPDSTAPALVATSGVDGAAWTQALLDHRSDVDEELRTSTTSPMAGVQRLASEPVDRLFLILQDGAFAVSETADPGAQLAVSREGTSWTWEPLKEDVVGEAEGEPVAPDATLPGPTVFSVAGHHVRFYPGDTEVIFTVFDPERPERKEFEHLLYYPPDRSYAVPAQLVRLPAPEEVEMLTSRSLKKTFYRYARIRFRLDGEDRELTAFKSTLEGEGSRSLFIPFRDATSGSETYGAGRFLDVEEPEGQELVLDFNRAYNPLCNYSPAYNCPIPPRENHLPAPVRAGEKTYPH
jgi:uncharacterized protein (DUF1684 family)